MKIKFSTLTLLLIFTCGNLESQITVHDRKPFKAGEILEYEVYYSWGLVWVDAGYVKFSVKEEIVNDKTLFHFIGEGNSKKKLGLVF